MFYNFKKLKEQIDLNKSKAKRILDLTL